LLFDWRMERSGGADENDENARWNGGERGVVTAVPFIFMKSEVSTKILG
jgi:hypothetical protein